VYNKQLHNFSTCEDVVVLLKTQTIPIFMFFSRNLLRICLTFLGQLYNRSNQVEFVLNEGVYYCNKFYRRLQVTARSHQIGGADRSLSIRVQIQPTGQHLLLLLLLLLQQLLVRRRGPIITINRYCYKPISRFSFIFMECVISRMHGNC